MRACFKEKKKKNTGLSRQPSPTKAAPTSDHSREAEGEKKLRKKYPLLTDVTLRFFCRGFAKANSVGADWPVLHTSESRARFIIGLVGDYFVRFQQSGKGRKSEKAF